MKTVVVISVSRAVGETFVAQIKRFFKESVSVLNYCLRDEFDFAPGEVVAVLTGQRDESDAGKLVHCRLLRELGKVWSPQSSGRPRVQ